MCFNRKLTRGGVCGNIACLLCFERSFASVDRSRYWSKKNECKSYELPKGSDKKIIFDCSKCNHPFTSILYSVTNGNWCPYCANQKLCDDKNCKICFDKSLASHEKGKFFLEEANWELTFKVFKSCGKLKWFECCICKHCFQINSGLICYSSDASIILSSKNGHLDIVKYLVEHYVDIHLALQSSNENGAGIRFVLESSIENGHLELIKCLVEKGADIQSNNNYALRASSIKGYIEFVKYLVENGADISVYNNIGLRNINLEIQVYLIQKGLYENNDNLLPKEYDYIFRIQKRLYDKIRNKMHNFIWNPHTNGYKARMCAENCMKIIEFF